MQTCRSVASPLTNVRPILAASLLLAALASAPLHAAKPPAASRGTDSLTAIDVLLLPDQTMIDRAQRANAQLRENYPQGFALDAEHRTHITILQRYVRTKDLKAVHDAVNRVLN